ncbi:DNA repair protein RecO [Algicola sagamiensis]|uniref:DNA repair protein RecO n=1 Tax=Algicola sagamiensis TaxID=163869 RepID=UPI000366001B|nr:DNA repair protein RecO [Algicola sagamiensis]
MLSKAYILHTRPFRENSIIADCLVDQEIGRVSLFIRKGKKSQHQALCQPFQPLILEVTGHGDMKYANRLEAHSERFSLQGKHLFCALYMNELICRIWPKDFASERLFPLYESALQHLKQVDKSAIEPVLRQFEIALLDELGLGIDFQSANHGDYEVKSHNWYRFVPGEGFFLSYHRLRCFPGDALLQIAQLNFSETHVRLAAKQIMRLAFQPFIGDEPLKSRTFFQTRT